MNKQKLNKKNFLLSSYLSATSDSITSTIFVLKDFPLVEARERRCKKSELDKGFGLVHLCSLSLCISYYSYHFLFL